MQQGFASMTEELAVRKLEKKALIKQFNEHCRNAEPNHTAFCCQWCTDNGDAQIAVDKRIEELEKLLHC
jgi:hypothetical protein